MKIAIIGGGPAGLYAAQTAAAGGAETTLFEKRQVGDGIVCGEYLEKFNVACQYELTGDFSPRMTDAPMSA